MGVDGSHSFSFCEAHHVCEDGVTYDSRCLQQHKTGCVRRAKKKKGVERGWFASKAGSRVRVLCICHVCAAQCERCEMDGARYLCRKRHFKDKGKNVV